MKIRFGKQAVVPYRNGLVQVSTYGLNGWIMTFCYPHQIGITKREHHSRISNGCV